MTSRTVSPTASPKSFASAFSTRMVTPVECDVRAGYRVVDDPQRRAGIGRRCTQALHAQRSGQRRRGDDRADGDDREHHDQIDQRQAARCFTSGSPWACASPYPAAARHARNGKSGCPTNRFHIECLRTALPRGNDVDGSQPCCGVLHPVHRGKAFRRQPRCPSCCDGPEALRHCVATVLTNESVFAAHATSSRHRHDCCEPGAAERFRSRTSRVLAQRGPCR